MSTLSHEDIILAVEARRVVNTLQMSVNGEAGVSSTVTVTSHIGGGLHYSYFNIAELIDVVLDGYRVAANRLETIHHVGIEPSLAARQQALLSMSEEMLTLLARYFATTFGDPLALQSTDGLYHGINFIITSGASSVLHHQPKVIYDETIYAATR